MTTEETPPSLKVGSGDLLDALLQHWGARVDTLKEVNAGSEYLRGLIDAHEDCLKELKFQISREANVLTEPRL